MTEQRSRIYCWARRYLVALIAFDAVMAAVSWWFPPADQTRGLAFLALSAAFTAVWIATGERR